MMKRALAIALMGMGLSFAGAAANAAAVSVPSLASMAAPAVTPVLYNGACLDLPVVGTFVAFFELLTDEEHEYHCTRHFDGDHYYKHTYEPREPRRIRPLK